MIKKYERERTIHSLIKKNCLINRSETSTTKIKGQNIAPKTIEVGFARRLGNGSWGQIGFLKSRYGYKVSRSKMKKKLLTKNITHVKFDKGSRLRLV